MSLDRIKKQLHSDLSPKLIGDFLDQDIVSVRKLTRSSVRSKLNYSADFTVNNKKASKRNRYNNEGIPINKLSSSMEESTFAKLIKQHLEDSEKIQIKQEPVDEAENFHTNEIQIETNNNIEEKLQIKQEPVDSMDLDSESCSIIICRDTQVSPLLEKLSSNDSDFSEYHESDVRSVHSVTNVTVKSIDSDSTDSAHGSSINQDADQETTKKYMKGEVFIFYL